MVVAKAVSQWPRLTSAAEATNQVASQDKAETKRNASALKCLNQVLRAQPILILTHHNHTAPVTEPTAPVLWEQVRRLIVSQEPVDQVVQAAATKATVQAVAADVQVDQFNLELS
ncbi:hypothetical protein GCM10023183_23500 [Nibribacter koreensis]|uniref:Uncharacterized protein n=1 Tax=Nibribacter koreensis TaxID=1084519 RepID=A0ABP8FND3_9BACT